MAKKEVLDALRAVTQEQERQWLIDLGAALTISARNVYPTGEQPGKPETLIGFNELQHQVYGRISHIGRRDLWRVESFLDGLIQKAQHYGIGGELGLAIKDSIYTLGRRSSGFHVD